MQSLSSAITTPVLAQTPPAEIRILQNEIFCLWTQRAYRLVRADASMVSPSAILHQKSTRSYSRLDHHTVVGQQLSGTAGALHRDGPAELLPVREDWRWLNRTHNLMYRNACFCVCGPGFCELNCSKQTLHLLESEGHTDPPSQGLENIAMLGARALKQHMNLLHERKAGTWLRGKHGDGQCGTSLLLM